MIRKELVRLTKALIVYGTRYGATAKTSEEIGKIFGEKGFEVKIVDAKKEKVKDLAEYDLIVVGSGIKINSWTPEAEDFLKNFHKELTKKKVALFVSCGHGCQAEHEGNPEVIAKFRGKYLEEKAAKYDLHPIDLGFFGGIQDFTKISWLEKMAPPIREARRKMEAFYGEKRDVYDARDLEAIRNWAKELARKVEAG